MKRKIQIVTNKQPVITGLEDLLDRDFNNDYFIEGNELFFKSIGGSVKAFGINPEKIDNRWEITIEIENMERDYGVSAAISQELAKKYDGKAIDSVLPDPLWPPFNGGDDHPVITTVNFMWNFETG